MILLKVAPVLLLLAINMNDVLGLREYSKQDLEDLKQQVKGVFYHAYNGYLNYAFPYDELRPLSCDGIDTWGSYSLTLIDALDTLAIMGNYTEFARVVELITERANFDININVSVFETNIRIIGGLLSAHMFSEKAGLQLDPGWPCNGPLLRLAEDVARRLLPAFDTDTGMPYGTVNLRYGVPVGETPVTCTAGVATYIIEFGTLSRLTGDPIYEEVALRGLRSLFKRKSSLGLFGNHIDTKTGIWTAQDSGIGAGVDSYFEYLVKGAILFQRPELLAMFNEIRGPIDKFLKRDDWYLWVSMHKGQVTLPVFQSLEAFWPGVLSLIGDVSGGMKSLHNYHQVWKQYGFLPEFYNIVNSEAGTNRESYPLRPELIESVMYLYRATGDPYLLDVGQDMLNSIQHSARTPCGYATIKNVVDHSQEDRMESFFLAETTKYLYLLFDTENFIHDDGNKGRIFETGAGKMCVLGAGGYIFNTEAHPIDVSALQCCSSEKLGHLNLDFSRPKRKHKANSERTNDNLELDEQKPSDAVGTENTDAGNNGKDSEDNTIENKIESIEKEEAMHVIDKGQEPNLPRVQDPNLPSEQEPNLPSGPSPLDQTLGNKGTVQTFAEKIKTALSKYLPKNKKIPSEYRKARFNEVEDSLLDTIKKRVEDLNAKEAHAIDSDTRSKSGVKFSAQDDRLKPDVVDLRIRRAQILESETKDSEQRNFEVTENIKNVEENIQEIENKLEATHRISKSGTIEKLVHSDKGRVTKLEAPYRLSVDELITERIHLIQSEYNNLDSLDRDALYTALVKGGLKLRQNQKKLDEAMRDDLLEVKLEMKSFPLNEEDLLKRLQNLKALETLQIRLDAMKEQNSNMLEINAHLGILLKSVLTKLYVEAENLSSEQSRKKVNAIELEMKRIIAAQNHNDPLLGSNLSELSDSKISVNSSITAPDDNFTEDNLPISGNYTLNLPSGAYAIVDHTVLNGLSKPVETHAELPEDNNDTDQVKEPDPCAGLAMDPLRLCQLAQNPPPVFHPQALYAKIISQSDMYLIPGMWNAHYSLLTCAPQPFFTKFTLRGEFFESA